LTKHLGIVAASPEGASLCYRQIFRVATELLDPDQHPIVTIHNLPLAGYVTSIKAGDWRAVGHMLATSAQTLASCGAELCLSPDNAIQHATHLAEANSPIPWLNMVEIVGERLQRDARTTAGVIGTSVVTGGAAYQTTLGMRGIKVVAPSDEDRDKLDEVIFQDLAYGRITQGGREVMFHVMENMRERGCDSLILGCSEAPLVISQENAPLPVYDTTRILAEEAVRAATEPAPA